MMEDELLCDAWLVVSTDLIVRSGGEPLWEQAHEKLHARKHIAPYDMHIIHERNVKSLAYRWSTTHNSVSKFCGAVDRLEAMWPLRDAVEERRS